MCAVQPRYQSRIFSFFGGYFCINRYDSASFTVPNPSLQSYVKPSGKDLDKGVSYTHEEATVMIEALKSPEVAAAAIGALLGAAAAFLLVIIRDSYRRIASRKAHHYTALVILDGDIFSHERILKNNIQIINLFIRSLKRGSLYWTVMQTIEFDASRVNDLHNIKLIVAFEEYKDLIRQHNADVTNIGSTYKLLEEAYISGKISEENFKDNCSYIASKLQDDMLGFMEELLLVIIMLKSMVKQLIKDDLTWGMNLQQKLVGQTAFDTKTLEKKARQTRKAEMDKLNKKIKKLIEEEPQAGKKG